MADILFAGFYSALEQGRLDMDPAAPDVRCLLVGTGFTAEPDAVHLSDFADLAEFDGPGYVRLDGADVVTGYVSADDEWRLDLADGSFGDPVAPGSTAIGGMVVYLHVDGTPAADIALAFTDAGGFGVNANNGPLDLIVPAAGLLFVRQAA
jgi:hypothetical protein